MAIKVTAQGLSFEFPEGTSKDDIKKAVSRVLGQDPKQRPKIVKREGTLFLQVGGAEIPMRLEVPVRDGTDGRDGRDGEEGERGERGKPGQEGAPGRNGKDGQDGAPGPAGSEGKPGRDGMDGKDGMQGQPGEKGDSGPAPAHQVKNGEIRFQNPDGSWGQWIKVSQSRGGAGGGASSAAFGNFVLKAGDTMSGNLIFPDNISSGFGTDSDAGIAYDGTDLIYNSQFVGVGDHRFQGGDLIAENDVHFGDGTATGPGVFFDEVSFSGLPQFIISNELGNAPYTSGTGQMFGIYLETTNPGTNRRIADFDILDESTSSVSQFIRGFNAHIRLRGNTSYTNGSLPGYCVGRYTAEWGNGGSSSSLNISKIGGVSVLLSDVFGSTGYTVQEAFGYQTESVQSGQGTVTLGHGFLELAPNAESFGTFTEYRHHTIQMDAVEGLFGTGGTQYGIYFEDRSSSQWATNKDIFSNGVLLSDATTGMQFQVGGTTRIETNGTGIGLFNTSPVGQYSTTGTTTGFTAGSGTGVNDDSTFTGNTGSTAYTIGDIVRALKLLGIMAA